MKNPKAAFKNTGQEIQKRTFRDLFNRLSFAVTGVTQRVIRIVPAQARWLIPFIKEDLGIKTPTLEEMAEQLRPKPQAEVVEGEIIEELVTIPEALPLEFLGGDLPEKLVSGKEIQGIRLRYQVEKYLGDRGNGRIYQGIDMVDRRPVVIKEYPLDLYRFDEQDLKERKKRFKSFAGIALADGKVQDFRLIQPLDAIPDTNKDQKTNKEERRCYLIYDYALIYDDTLKEEKTLANFLKNSNDQKMSEQEVYSVLDQVLQSLQFLHTQKFRFPNGMVTVGLSHGNLQLANLIIVKKAYSFLVYLRDLSLWEQLFNGAKSANSLFEKESSQQQDLRDLGRIAFALLAGDLTGNNLDPGDENNWPPLVNYQSETQKEQQEKFKNFIKKLMALGIPGYNSAELARQDLLKINVNYLSSSLKEIPVIPEPETKKKKNYRLLFLIFGGLGLLILALLIWFFWGRNKPVEVIANNGQVSLEQITGIPTGKFIYLAEFPGVWRSRLTDPNIFGAENTLEKQLNQLQPELQLKYQLVSIPIIEALALSNPDREYFADFGVTTLIDDFPGEFNYEKFAYEKFAYDGIVFFVAFSYANRDNSLPTALNGKISIEDLRKLYTGQIKNWQDIGGPDLPVKQLYIPKDKELLTIFKQRVLKEQTAMDAFNDLLNNKDKTKPTITEINNTAELLRTIIRDNEKSVPVASIGFDALSKVFGQCSVYPLAIADTNNSNGISPLLEQETGQPITPKIDLCKKGSYRLNQEVFISQTYPLTYSLAVVYPRDNRQQPVGKKFAEILQSSEVQTLLQETNLVPLQPLQ